MEYINSFSHRDIGVRNYLVTEHYGTGHRCNIGVILGMERILVVDSGLGMGGNLRKYIETFAGTTMPIFTMSTHGAADCVGGVKLFDEAYLHHGDWGMADSFDPEKRIALLDQYAGADENLKAFGRLLATDNSAPELKDMHQGDHLHLGGVHVEVFEIPGVTAGSCVIRITREGVARTSFVGDALNYEYVRRLRDEARRDYVEKLRELAEIMTEDEPMFGTHQNEPMVRADILSLAERLKSE